MPAQLRLPPVPAALQHVWEWFGELSSSRSGNGGGPNPLSFVEIEAWARLTGRLPAPREVQAIMALDMELFTLWAEQNRRRETARKAQEAKRR
jgi:hypothetical protein